MRASLVRLLCSVLSVQRIEISTPYSLVTNMKRRFMLERRNGEVIRSIRRQPQATGGNGGNEADFDEVGAYDGEGPPVPIPNTEVKLIGGENTCLATDREDSTVPTQNSDCKSSRCFLFLFSKD